MSSGLAHNIYSRVLNWVPEAPVHLSFRELSSHNCYFGTTLGCQRSNNQDQVFFAELDLPSKMNSLSVFIVLDGMGGMREGAECSKMAFAAFIASLVTSEEKSLHAKVNKAVLAANRAVHNSFKGNGGTTLSSVVTDGVGEAVFANVGDSRIYKYTPGGMLTQLSEDDTVGIAMAKSNKMLEGRLDDSDGTFNQLVQYVGVGEGIDPRIENLELNSDEGFILVSDGAFKGPKDLFKLIVQNAKTPSKIVQRVLNESEWLGGLDNATILCVGPRESEGIMLAKKVDSLYNKIRIHSIAEVLEIQGQIASRPDNPAISRDQLELPNMNESVSDEQGGFVESKKKKSPSGITKKGRGKKKKKKKQTKRKSKRDTDEPLLIEISNDIESD